MSTQAACEFTSRLELRKVYLLYATAGGAARLKSRFVFVYLHAPKKDKGKIVTTMDEASLSNDNKKFRILTMSYAKLHAMPRVCQRAKQGRVARFGDIGLGRKIESG